MADVHPEVVSKVDAGARAAESGDKAALAAILNAENVYDRQALAGGIKQSVDRDRADSSKAGHASLPDLQLVTQPDATGKPLLTDIKNGQDSLYHNEISSGTYDSRYSFSHPKMTTYDTLDPTTGQVVSEDLVRADGVKAHVTVDYDKATQKLTAKTTVWDNGVTEHDTYDDQGRKNSEDTQFKNGEGKLVHNHTDTKFDPVTGKRASTTDKFSDGTVSVSTFDAQNRLVSQDSNGPDKKEFHYSAKYDDKSGKLVYEKQLRNDSSEVRTFDPITGKPLTSNEAYSWGTISEEHRYDDYTHNEIYDHTEHSDGSQTTTIRDSDGRFVSQDSIRADKKTSHKGATYDGRNLMTTDEVWYDGSTSHMENQYDKTSGNLVKQSTESKSANGAKSTHVDQFDAATGKLNSEDFEREDGSREHYQYDRVPSPNAKSGEKQINITETDTTTAGVSSEFKYEYRYNTSTKPPTDRLQIKWSGTGPDGSYTEAEQERIQKFMFQHADKIREVHR